MPNRRVKVIHPNDERTIWRGAGENNFDPSVRYMFLETFRSSPKTVKLCSRTIASRFVVAAVQKTSRYVTGDILTLDLESWDLSILHPRSKTMA